MKRRQRGSSGEPEKTAAATSSGIDEDLFDEAVLHEQLQDAAIEIPIQDVLDLHPFSPKEVSSVVRDYLDAAFEKGLRELRIIHGRGIGVQRQTVRNLLERDPRVLRFGDAPGEAGGWGATLVWLSEDSVRRDER